ncbi:alpha/beta hydrolase [Pseudoalteromonas neustonica]|uniref:Alpha/beta hydrolase n=1 Tax=Pseudoalteromonas neustonica TaxID=1840331 RepID=A0ABU9U375_9GAMM
MKPVFSLCNKLAKLVSLITFLYFFIAAVTLALFSDYLIFKGNDLTLKTEQKTLNIDDHTTTKYHLFGDLNNQQCVIFFPGRHGLLSHYQILFTKLNQQGITVYALSYPGFEGAIGQARQSSITQLNDRTIRTIFKNSQCNLQTTVFTGRSLGSFLALSSAATHHPAGIIVDSVPVSLSDSMDRELKTKWYLKPMSLLPLNLLIKNVRLTDLLAPIEPLYDQQSIVIIQGESDVITPLSSLQNTLKSYHRVKLIQIKKADHSNVFILGEQTYIEYILRNVDKK